MNTRTKHKPRLNAQKHTLPNRAVWTGPGSCAHGKLPMYSLNARDHHLLSPPFLMTSTTKQMRPNGKGGLCMLSVSARVRPSVSGRSLSNSCTSLCIYRLLSYSFKRNYKFHSSAFRDVEIRKPFVWCMITIGCKYVQIYRYVIPYFSTDADLKKGKGASMGSVSVGVEGVNERHTISRPGIKRVMVVTLSPPYLRPSKDPVYTYQSQLNELGAPMRRNFPHKFRPGLGLNPRSRRGSKVR